MAAARNLACEIKYLFCEFAVAGVVSGASESLASSPSSQSLASSHSFSPISFLCSPATASFELEMAAASERPRPENLKRHFTQCEPVHFGARTFRTDGS